MASRWAGSERAVRAEREGPFLGPLAATNASVVSLSPVKIDARNGPGLGGVSNPLWTATHLGAISSV